MVGRQRQAAECQSEREGQNTLGENWAAGIVALAYVGWQRSLFLPILHGPPIALSLSRLLNLGAFRTRPRQCLLHSLLPFLVKLRHTLLSEEELTRTPVTRPGALLHTSSITNVSRATLRNSELSHQKGFKGLGCR